LGANLAATLHATVYRLCHYRDIERNITRFINIAREIILPSTIGKLRAAERDRLPPDAANQKSCGIEDEP
jgi:hypothetical protein